MPHVVIIGGGVSGLSTAFAMQEACEQNRRSIDCTVIDSQQQWGGKIQTEHSQGLVIEGGPDSFLSIKPWARDLCLQLGLKDQLINTNQEHNRTFCFTRGKLREIPQGLVSFIPTRIGSLFSSGLMSWPGILRMGGDWFIPPKRSMDADESLAAFFCRRVGQEAFDRLIEPLVAGIYAGDARQLSLKATFPRFRELEQKHGGLIKGVLAQRSTTPSLPAGPTPSMFVTLRGGLGKMIEALISRVENRGATLRLGQQAIGLQMTTDPSRGFKVILQNGEILAADRVVFATPAFVSSKLIQPHHSTLSNLLDQIPYASTATVSLAYRADDIPHSVQGFGFVIPRKEGKSLIAATWTSLKWANRTPSNQTLIRCYVGGTGREDVLEYDDDALENYVRKELGIIVGMHHPPIYSKVFRWDRSMPQYTCGHLERLRKIRECQQALPGIYLTGAAYEGIGIPDCIREGSRVGAELAKSFK